MNFESNIEILSKSVEAAAQLLEPVLMKHSGANTELFFRINGEDAVFQDVPMFGTWEAVMTECVLALQENNFDFTITLDENARTVTVSPLEKMTK